MTSTDIVRIIKACKDTGIKSLEYGDLILKFEEDEPETSAIWPQMTPRSLNVVDNIEELTHNEEIVDEDEDELLKLQDPLEWEKRQVNG